MKNKIMWLIVAIVVIIIVIVGASSKSDNRSIKIGGLFMLTGPQATFGEAQKRAAEMAVSRFNSSGGWNNKNAELFLEDTASDPKKAVDAYYALKNKGVHIFDVEGSPLAAAVRKLIIDDGGFVMTSGATTPVYYDENIRSCRLTVTAKMLGKTISDFFIKNSYKNVFLLVPNNEYGKGVADELNKAFITQGGIVVGTEYYDATGGGDYRTNITKIKSKQNATDVLFAVNALNTVESMFKQISDLGWSKPIVSDYNTLSNPALKNLSIVNGVQYVDWDYTPEPSDTDAITTRDFKVLFTKNFGKNPSLLDAGYYDGINTILSSIKSVGDDAQKMGEYISSLKNYQLVTGVAKSFDADCEATRELIFRKIHDGKIVKI